MNAGSWVVVHRRDIRWPSGKETPYGDAEVVGPFTDPMQADSFASSAGWAEWLTLEVKEPTS